VLIFEQFSNLFAQFAEVRPLVHVARPALLDDQVQVGVKSLRSPELELSGRKWEDGCSNNNEGFFFLHSRAFLVSVLLVMGEVAGLVVDVALFVVVVEGCLVVVVVRFVVVLVVTVVD